MKVFIEKENKNVDIDQGCTGVALLKQLDINPSTVLLVKGREVVLLEEIFSETDEVTILSVVSGG